MTRTPPQRRLYGEVDPRWRRRFSAVARAAGWVVVIGGALAILGRALDIPILAQWIPRSAVRPMQPASALAFVGGGLAVLAGLGSRRPWVRRFGLALAALVFL